MLFLVGPHLVEREKIRGKISKGKMSKLKIMRESDVSSD
jgi:hypothetical protein